MPEVADSRAILEEVVGGPVPGFAYPYGAFNEAAVSRSARPATTTPPPPTTTPGVMVSRSRGSSSATATTLCGWRPSWSGTETRGMARAAEGSHGVLMRSVLAADRLRQRAAGEFRERIPYAPERSRHPRGPGRASRPDSSAPTGTSTRALTSAAFSDGGNEPRPRPVPLDRALCRFRGPSRTATMAYRPLRRCRRGASAEGGRRLSSCSCSRHRPPRPELGTMLITTPSVVASTWSSAAAARWSFGPSRCCHSARPAGRRPRARPGPRRRPPEAAAVHRMRTKSFSVPAASR